MTYKLWGKVDTIINSEKYCGQKLYLKKGFQSSLHYHKESEKTFYLSSGLVYMETEYIQWIMQPGHRQHICPDMIHRFTGLEESVLFVFSTEYKKSDIYVIEPAIRTNPGKIEELLRITKK